MYQSTNALKITSEFSPSETPSSAQYTDLLVNKESNTHIRFEEKVIPSHVFLDDRNRVLHLILNIAGNNVKLSRVVNRVSCAQLNRDIQRLRVRTMRNDNANEHAKTNYTTLHSH